MGERTEVSIRQELESLRNLSPEQQQARLMRIAEILGPELEKSISPPGQCKAALVRDFPLLEERRLMYAIPDKAFDQEAVYDRILVHQIPRVFGDKVGSGILYMPDSARRREEESSVRGVIVSAGLKALGVMRSNGIDIGHIVNFIRLAPFRLPYMTIKGQELSLIVMRDGDIVSSEELPALRDQEKVRTIVHADGEYSLAVDSLTPAKPKMPFIAEDY